MGLSGGCCACAKQSSNEAFRFRDPGTDPASHSRRARGSRTRPQFRALTPLIVLKGTTMSTAPVTDWGQAIMTSVAAALALLLSAIPKVIGFAVILIVG